LSARPEQIPVEDLDGFYVATLAWALERPVDEVIGGLDREELIAGTPMDQAVLASFDEDGDLNFQFLRRGIHRFHACQQEFPLTLEGFQQKFGAWELGEGSLIPESIPKDGPRRLVHLPEIDGVTAYVAETLLDDDSVRETEIVLQSSRSDGALDFVVYDEAGDLSGASAFAMGPNGYVQSAVPYTCLVCHVDVDDEIPVFDVVHPDM